MIGPTEIIVLVFIGVLILPYWKIFSKAGFPGWYSLSLIVPLLNIVALFYLAFAEWPIYRELERNT